MIALQIPAGVNKAVSSGDVSVKSAGLRPATSKMPE
jgi:hypothetical protein